MKPVFCFVYCLLVYSCISLLPLQKDVMVFCIFCSSPTSHLIAVFLSCSSFIVLKRKITTAGEVSSTDMQKYIINHLLVCRIKIFILLLTPSQNSVAGNRLLVFFVDANDFKFVSGI